MLQLYSLELALGLTRELTGLSLPTPKVGQLLVRRGELLCQLLT